MSVARSIVLFAVAALFEIGGAWLVWQSVREHRGWIWAGLGVIALGAYGFVATFQADPQFGRVLAAYGGVFVGPEGVVSRSAEAGWNCVREHRISDHQDPERLDGGLGRRDGSV